MYRILIADDEKIGRDGIIFLLKNMNLDMTIHSVANGKQAIEYIQNNEIDFLLTDIKMPFMDGLELIRQAFELQPDIKVIIFSGYSDFDYAKKAISQGVSEYILKPVDPEEFEKSINKIIREYESDRSNQKRLIQNDKLMKQYILHSLLNGNFTEGIEKENGIKLDDFKLDYHRVILLDFNNGFFDIHDDILKNLHSIIDIGFDYLNISNTQSFLLFYEEDFAVIKALANSIIKFINIHYNRRAYIAISDYIDKVEELNSCCDRLEGLIENRYFNSESQLFDFDKQVPIISNNVKEIDDLIEMIKQAIKIKDLEKIKESINVIYNMYNVKDNPSIEYLKFMFAEVIKDLCQALDLNEQEIKKISIKYYRSEDFRTVSLIVNNLLSELEKQYSQNSSIVHKKIDSVIKYIYNHYNEDLSVDALADYVCLAPSYLSHIFKKETNYNLGKYIKMVRMEKAIDMLENSHEKIVTIAVAVGYQNVSYFCQCFREYYGVSPQKYRAQGE